MAIVKINRTWFKEENEIKEEVVRTFQNLLTTTGDQRSSVSGMSFERLEDQKVVGLEEPFSDKEIFGALSNFSGDKALGPDEFSMTF